MNASSTAFGVDPGDLQVPEGLSPPSGDAGEVVVLVAEEGARRDGWAARMAVKLAREWASGGLRVFLADGDLSDASLHGVVGVANAEGLADVIVHGASPGRVVQRVEGSGFLFASAGTVVADPTRAYEHPRWSVVLDAFRESGSVLVLYLPSEAGSSGLVERGDRVIRLADAPPGEAAEPGVTVIHLSGTEPARVQPDMSEPVADEPAIDEVPVGEAATTEPVIREPELAGSGATDPGVSDPGVPDPGVSEAAALDPEGDPALADPVAAGSVDVQDGAPAGSEAGSAGATGVPSGSGEGSPPGAASGPAEPTWPGAEKRPVKPADGNRLRLVLLVVLLLVAVLFLGERLGFFDLPGVSSWLDAGVSHSIASG